MADDREVDLIKELKLQFRRLGILEDELFLKFQRNYGGKQQIKQGGFVTWGIMHADPQYMSPLAIELFDEAAGFFQCPRLRCLDSPDTEAMYLDEEGAVYNSVGVRVFDNPANIFILERLLEAHTEDPENLAALASNWSNVFPALERVQSFKDSTTRLYHHGDGFITTLGDQPLAYYKLVVVKEEAAAILYIPALVPTR